MLKLNINFLSKLKLLDYLIITVLILLTVFVIGFFNPKKEWITITLVSTNTPTFLANSLNIGDYEGDLKGGKTAIIENKESYDSYQDPDIKKDVITQIKLLVHVGSADKEFEYKNKVINIGTPLDFNFNSGTFRGVVAKVGDGYLSYNGSKILTVKLSTQSLWLADNLNIGDGEINSKGEKILEIIGKNVLPAEDISYSSPPIPTSGKFDIVLRLKVKGTLSTGDFLYQNYRKLLIGYPFSFSTKTTRVSEASIIKIE